MNIINITLGVDTQPCSSITLGRRGENEVTQVVVDFSSWVEEFGAGVITLLAMRSQDTSAYPVVLSLDGNTATWNVTSTDTAYKGSGRAEYIYTVGDQIAKSVVFNTVVMQDIGEPSETPPDPYEDWLERLTELGAETQANAEAAEQSAENAAESAEDAAQSAASAEGYAGQAETAAGLAQAAQTASEAARDAAQTAQASAEASATVASGSAASAAESATAAAGSASDASASATAAGASATAASASATTASNAATAAQAAQSAAEDAAEDAQEAAQQAHVEYEQLSGEVDDLSDEVSQQKSAIEDLEALVDRKAGALIDTASGAIASFVPDASVENLLGLTVNIEPVQDLHGFDSPWPAGGGKNLLPLGDIDSIKAINTRGTWNGNQYNRNGITFTLLTDSGENIIGIKVDGTSTAGTSISVKGVSQFTLPAGTYTFTGVNEYFGGYDLNIRKQGESTDTVQRGSPVTLDYSEDTVISSAYLWVNDNKTLSNVYVYPMICDSSDPDSTVFAPYSNECPISGWDAVEVDAAGVNLFGGEVSQLAFASYAEGDVIIARETYRSIFTRVKSGKTYTVSRKTIEGNRFRVVATVDYPANGVPCRILANDAQQDNALTITVTIPDGYNYIFVYLSNQADACTAGNYQIELGSTAHDYHPYAGNRYVIQLGQTVYGAKLTISEDGSVTALIDRAMVDLGTLSWRYISSYNGVFYAPVANAKLMVGTSGAMCSIFKPTSGQDWQYLSDCEFILRRDLTATNVCAVAVRYDAFSDASDFQLAVDGQTLVFPLETPITITLDPVTISTISGQTNNVWADAGDVDVTFAADLKAYIDSKIAAAVAALS